MSRLTHAHAATFSIVIAAVLIAGAYVSTSFAEEPSKATVQALADKTDQVAATQCFETLRKFGLKGENVNGNVIDINPTLACRLAKYLEAVKNMGCNPKISSGYRSVSAQKRACTNVCGDPNGCTKAQGHDGGCAPPGSSCHQYGAAVDVSGASKGKGCERADGAFAAQYGLIFGYSGNPSIPADNRGSGKNHFQCIENRTSGASSCAPPNKICGGLAADALPPEYDQKSWDFNRSTNENPEGASERLIELEQGIRNTDATGVAPGSAGTTAGSNPLSNAIQQALSSPAQQSTTPESNTTSNAFKCLFAAFGSDAEGCADTQARALLGDELGVTDTVGATGEDSAVGSSGNDTLSNAAVCSDSGSSISRSDTGCLQVGGQGGADNNVPAISTGSVTQTIKDSAVTDSVGAPGPVAQKFISLGQMFDWPSATGSQASQYDGQLFYAGDLPNGLYYDSYTDTVRYESSGREVSPAVLKVLMSEDTASPTSTQSVSWLGVTGSLVRGALPVLGFTFPLASFFSF